MVHWGDSNVVRFQSEWLRGGGSVPGACNVGILCFYFRAWPDGFTIDRWTFYKVKQSGNSVHVEIRLFSGHLRLEHFPI